MIRAAKAGRHAERGATLVEFTFASVLILLFLFGAFDFGRAMMTYHLVTNAARLGTRYAMVHGASCSTTGCPTTAAAVSTYVISKSPGVPSGNLTVTTTWGPSPGCSSTAEFPGCWVNVTVSYPFRFTGFFGTKNLSASSQMIISQ